VALRAISSRTQSRWFPAYARTTVSCKPRSRWLQRDPHGAASGTQLPIEGGERQPQALRKFEIRRVVKRKSTALCQGQCRPPRMAIRFSIDGDGERAQIGNRGVAICGAYSLASNRRL